VNSSIRLGARPAIKKLGIQGGEYRGPGGLWVEVIPNIAVVKGSRWNGFSRNKPLRTVQLSAYRSIARALNSPMMVVCTGDDCGEFLDWNSTQDAIIAGLRARLGPPALSLDIMEDPTTEESSVGSRLPGILGCRHGP
jgi:hypothetical protein